MTEKLRERKTKSGVALADSLSAAVQCLAEILGRAVQLRALENLVEDSEPQLESRL